jgi:hypothetical protein
MSRLLARLLVTATDAILADSIFGDLEEERRRRASRSRVLATLWMARTTLADRAAGRVTSPCTK